VELGDKYSHLCLIDTQSGESMEEGRLRTTPEAFRRRFSSGQPLRIAIEAGTHSPWVSRMLEECGHEVLVANSRKLRLIYANKRKTDEVDALRTWLAWHASIRSCCTPSSTAVRRARLIWPSSARVRRWSVAVRSWSITSLRSGQILLIEGCPSARRGASTRKLLRTSRRYSGPWAHPGADRLVDGAYPRLRAPAGGDLQRALPGNRALAPGRGSRDAYGAYLRADVGGSLPLREEPQRGRLSGAGAGQGSVGG
jgi:hypothetical protein